MVDGNLFVSHRAKALRVAGAKSSCPGPDLTKPSSIQRIWTKDPGARTNRLSGLLTMPGQPGHEDFAPATLYTQSSARSGHEDFAPATLRKSFVACSINIPNVVRVY